MKVVASICLSASLATVAYAQPLYDNCDVESYYSPLLLSAGQDSSKWTTEDIQTLLVSTHRNVLPVVGSTEDIYDALIDLYPGDTPGETVHLVYRNISFQAEPYANPNTWSRADIWPLEFHGVTRDSDAFTDVHGKMCADTTVLAEQGSLFFGECGTMQDQALCVAPQEAPDARTDGIVWTPPESFKGDIARQLFYMAVRYGGEDQLNLTLVDCPPFGKEQFGYLSTLLQWHAADPVDEQERTRNSRSCEHWQGNRNVFIDYPELVSQIFGLPDEILPGSGSFSMCVGRTIAVPTALPIERTTAVPTISPIERTMGVPTVSPIDIPNADVDPDFGAFPDDGIDYCGCFEDLVAADRNNDGLIKYNEYLPFIQEYGKRICHSTDQLSLEQSAAFNALACICRSREGNSDDCCLGENAQIETDGALNYERTKEQQFYLIAVCKVTNGTIKEPRGCPETVHHPDNWRMRCIMTHQSPTMSPSITTQSPTMGPANMTLSPTIRPAIMTQTPTMGHVTMTQSPTMSPSITTQSPAISPATTTLSPTTRPTAIMTQSPTMGPVTTTQSPTMSAVLASEPRDYSDGLLNSDSSFAWRWSIPNGLLVVLVTIWVISV